MAWKNLKQKSLADGLMADHTALEELDDINELIDWDRVESMLSDIHSNPKGEKAWPPLMMFKALLLQSWYNLSDPGLEKQLARDLLFRRFVDLSLSESVPDHSTFWRFRNLLEKAGLAKQNRPKKDKHGNNTQDPEAAYNVKQGSDGKRNTTYGFKAHANVEEDDFIKNYDYTAGNTHDSNIFEKLLTGNEQEVYADSAYKSNEHDLMLEDKGIRNRVLERAYRNKPLTSDQKFANRNNSGTRSIVERVFGVLKLHYGMSKARYMGLARNKARFGLMSLAYNIKRGAMIQRSLQQFAGWVPLEKGETDENTKYGRNMI